MAAANSMKATQDRSHKLIIGDATTSYPTWEEAAKVAVQLGLAEWDEASPPATGPRELLILTDHVEIVPSEALEAGQKGSLGVSSSRSPNEDNANAGKWSASELLKALNWREYGIYISVLTRHKNSTQGLKAR